MTLPPAVPPPPPRNVRHILRVVGWNLLFILVGLLLIWIAGEAYFRLSNLHGNYRINLWFQLGYWRFVPGIGLMRPPHIDLVLSYGVDFWMVQRANSLGFLDREPIDPARAAASCHITIIGDSFVEAKEVPVSDKLQVRLEEIATREASHLDVTTSAFGFSTTGQVNQLTFYDRYARRMSPDLVVLVFVANDPSDNSSERYALTPGRVPDRLPYGQAARDVNGEIIWLPPAIDFSGTVFSRATETMNSWSNRAIYRVARQSYFIRWLSIKAGLIVVNPSVYKRFKPSEDDRMRYYEHRLLRENRMKGGAEIDQSAPREAWGFTSWGLEQFKRRADHDGAGLLLLANYDIGYEGYREFERLSVIAKSLGIPVVRQHDYIISRGGDIEGARWDNDYHWNPTGHRYAAEAIWEYIKDEWGGKCPEVEPQPDIKVDWVAVEEPLDELEYEDTVQMFQKPFGLWHHFYTPEGDAWVQSFPMFDLKGYQSVYESVTSSGPAMRADWDVHVYDDGLTYVKEPCGAEDVENRFFLHVIPVDDEVLTEEHLSHGFDDLSFDFYDKVENFYNKCMVSADLPEYDIDYIRTGQLAAGSKTWSAYYNFALPEIIDAVAKLQRDGREPAIRSGFDVYINDSRIIYVKDACSADDRDLPFFLHVFPADEKDLPSGREEFDFHNLDFELMYKGGESDGSCFAAVDLPAYEIARIRTGQWVRGERNVWEENIEFAE